MAVLISVWTALRGLRDQEQVWPGQKILIIGAVGGVGTFAVQQARLFGAQVTGVCGTAKSDLVRSIGAEDIIDHIRDDFADRRRIAACPLHRRHPMWAVPGNSSAGTGWCQRVPRGFGSRAGSARLSLSVPGPRVGM